MPEPVISGRDISLLHEKFGDGPEFENAVSRLKKREPLAYILGEWYFYGETYKVSRDCLVPRPETEHLVDFLIKNLPPDSVFADLCTGSGCIAISTLVHRKDCRAEAVDISENALAIARENAAVNSVSDRIGFIASDILTENPLGDRKFDVIVSNPPYIESDVIGTLEPEVLSEPKIALDGGNDGLDFYRVLLDVFTHNIKNGGYLVCEIGYDQGERLKKLCRCDILKDYSGNDRVMVLKINGSD